MKFKYLAIAAGGIGPDTWDKEIIVEGENMTIRQALDEIESSLSDTDGAVIAIEQVD